MAPTNMRCTFAGLSPRNVALPLSPYLALLLPKCPLCAVGFLSILGIDVFLSPHVRLILELCLLIPAAFSLVIILRRANLGDFLWRLLTAVGLLVWADSVQTQLALYTFLGILAMIFFSSLLRRSRRLPSEKSSHPIPCCDTIRLGDRRPAP